MRHSGIGAAAARFATALAAIALAIAACGDGDDEDSGPDEGAPRFGCYYETSLTDSCNNPSGSPWSEECVDVLAEDDCTLATMQLREEVGDCTFTTLFRKVRTTPMQPCPEAEGAESTGPSEIDPGELGEACSTLADCSSGLCVPRFYCTQDCSEDADCTEGFPGGCCVSEGSLGYCLADTECAELCPPNATPTGLPTICVCNDGFDWNADFTACEAA